MSKEKKSTTKKKQSKKGKEISRFKEKTSLWKREQHQHRTNGKTKGRKTTKTNERKQD